MTFRTTLSAVSQHLATLAPRAPTLSSLQATIQLSLALCSQWHNSQRLGGELSNSVIELSINLLDDHWSGALVCRCELWSKSSAEVISSLLGILEVLQSCQYIFVCFDGGFSNECIPS